MKSILDPSFRYTSSAQTDLKKTFARIRGAQGAGDRAGSETNAEAGSNVLPIQKYVGSGIEPVSQDRH